MMRIAIPISPRRSSFQPRWIPVILNTILKRFIWMLMYKHPRLGANGMKGQKKHLRTGCSAVPYFSPISGTEVKLALLTSAFYLSKQLTTGRIIIAFLLFLLQHASLRGWMTPRVILRESLFFSMPMEVAWFCLRHRALLFQEATFSWARNFLILFLNRLMVQCLGLEILTASLKTVISI